MPPLELIVSPFGQVCGGDLIETAIGQIVPLPRLDPIGFLFAAALGGGKFPEIPA
jgi:hypothetical protein